MLRLTRPVGNTDTFNAAENVDHRGFTDVGETDGTHDETLALIARSKVL